MTNWQDEIENDLKWREEELAALKKMLFDSDKDSIKNQALLRSLVVLLYAHFEGYCKFLWDLYLSVIEKSNTKRSKLIDEVAILSLSSTIKDVRNKSEDDIYNLLINNSSNLLNSPVKFESKLTADSNLKSHIYKENNRKINIKTETIDEHEKIINNLVGRRNEIAHGERNPIKNINDYKKYEHSVQIVMHDLAVKILDAIEKKKFIKN
ncbi:MAG: hypothetical protein HQL95_01595 [Magnetococcales bacterium]|nr:hypothetical protein [Magnetococcales bacterium]